MTGKEIIAAREKLGLTQAQLAKASGVPRSTLCELEKDRRTKQGPSHWTIEKLVAALDDERKRKARRK